MTRCLVQIDDARLRRRVGIDGEPGPPDQPLVGTGFGEFVAAGKGRPLVYVDGDSVAHPALLAAASRIRRPFTPVVRLRHATPAIRLGEEFRDALEFRPD